MTFSGVERVPEGCRQRVLTFSGAELFKCGVGISLYMKKCL